MQTSWLYSSETSIIITLNIIPMRSRAYHRHPRSVSCPFQVIIASRVHHSSDFCNCKLVLSVFELYVQRMLWNKPYCIWLLLFNVLCDFIHVSESWICVYDFKFVGSLIYQTLVIYFAWYSIPHNFTTSPRTKNTWLLELKIVYVEVGLWSVEF